MINFIHKTIKNRLTELHKFILRIYVSRVLISQKLPSFDRSETDFHILQSRYLARPEYGYDPFNIFKRAAERAVSILQLPGLDKPGLKGLDIGSGDGMLGVLLDKFGHNMVLNDIFDWRVPNAKSMEMIIADCSNNLPIDDNSYDFVVSFNSFEHFPEPTNVLSEIVRIIRPGGLIYLNFGPLFCSPWGLHAYRSFRMPYPQFLFSENFLHDKLKELGTWDLGAKRDKLQYLNRWKPFQYEALWSRPEITIVSCIWHIDDTHLNLISEYPECFSGRMLSLRDVISDSVIIVLRKNED